MDLKQELLNLVELLDAKYVSDKELEKHVLNTIDVALSTCKGKYFPYVGDLFSIIEKYYCDDSMMSYFDNDELIEHLDGTLELDWLIKEKVLDSIEEYKKENPPLKKEDILKEAFNFNGYDFKRFLCDVLQLQYHTSTEELIEIIKEKLTN